MSQLGWGGGTTQYTNIPSSWGGRCLSIVTQMRVTFCFCKEKQRAVGIMSLWMYCMYVLLPCAGNRLRSTPSAFELDDGWRCVREAETDRRTRPEYAGSVLCNYKEGESLRLKMEHHFSFKNGTFIWALHSPAIVYWVSLPFSAKPIANWIPTCDAESTTN